MPVLLFAVNEIKYEKIPVHMDGDTFDLSKEFRFVVPASSNYFTRYRFVYVCVYVLNYIVYVFLVSLPIVKW